ncbi:MAG: DJ-1/PfpI family protein [Puniceicoccales bacterium]|jgi:4-methyl-5(b-hydroxyethyl)-thiazole monophosphate biosynthesis|nr:DJ-1/PfpI family protein [Puniceicoccales bacterium]
MKSALIILFPDFEEIEAVSTIDVLRRGGMRVVLTAINSESNVVGAHGITCIADDVRLPEDLFDAVIIPGGPGVLRLRNDKILSKFILKHYNQGKLIAAICAAPLLLHDLGILDKHNYTCHFSVTATLKNAQHNESVVCDKNVITACGPAAGINFGLAILKFFESIQNVRDIAYGMMCNI